LIESPRCQGQCLCHRRFCAFQTPGGQSRQIRVCNPFKLPASRRFTECKLSTRLVFTSRQLAVNGYYGFRLNLIIASRNIFLAFFIASRNTEFRQTKGEQL